MSHNALQLSFLSVLQTLFVRFSTRFLFILSPGNFPVGWEGWLFQELMHLKILFWRQLNVKYIHLNIKISTVWLQRRTVKLCTAAAVGSYKRPCAWLTVPVDQFRKLNGTTPLSGYWCAWLFAGSKPGLWSRKKTSPWKELPNRKYMRGKEQRDISRWGTALRKDESWKRC